MKGLLKATNLKTLQFDAPHKAPEQGSSAAVNCHLHT